jgi:serine/threonine protein kinase
MNPQLSRCDHQRIDEFLRADRIQIDDADLIEHLEKCEACRAYMESLAAAPEDWTRIADLLRPSAFDYAGAAECSAATIGHQHVERSVVIQSVLDALTPAEDPHHLGRLDSYEVTGVIGAGGMGVVLKAVDPSLDRVVAIKVMAPHLAHNAAARKRFSREAKAAAAVLHPNVIPIHCVSSDHATPYLVMAYIRGGSLQKRIEREGPLPTVEILRIGAQIAAGLAVAHEQGLVHRDIKPENILLEEGIERVTLTDFGLARAVDDTSITQHGMIAGTPRYMSPEQARGESVDQKSDLFSLGSVLYTLCTGRPPFRASTTLGVMRRICEEMPTPILELNSDIPKWLAATIDRLMAKQREDRFGSAHEVQMLLESFLSHVQQPTVAELPPLSSIRGRPTRANARVLSYLQSRLGVFVMAVISIVTIAVLSFVVARDDGAPPQDADAQAGATAPERPALTDQTKQWSLGHGYSREGDHIYFDGKRIDQAGQANLEDFARTLGRPLVLAHDVDTASFASLSAEYAKDKNKVYYKWISPGQFWVVVIPDADPATFEVMDFNLAKDANRVWRTDVPIEGADAATAVVVNPHWVWKDRHNVYYQFTVLAEADPATFRHLDQAFYRDANVVYWSTTRLEGADVNTFRTFGNDVPYAADEERVWVGSNQLPQVDAASFRLLHNHVFADKSNVYVGGEALPVMDADAVTFRKVAELESADCVLFRDDEQHYIYDPLYNEVYTLTEVDNAVLIRKPVWLGDEGGTPRHAATVSATWSNGALSEPAIEMSPGFEGGQRPRWEIGKMQRMADPVREALMHEGLEAGDIRVVERAEEPGTPIDEGANAEQGDAARRTWDGPWDADLGAFDAHLAKLVRGARVPTIEDLTGRPMTEVMPITDGAGGLVDLRPAPDTVQHRVNEALKGKKVRWAFELAADEIDMAVTLLVPDLGFDLSGSLADAAPGEIPHLNLIMLKAPTRAEGAGPFKQGDRVIVEGAIGDATTNSGIMVTEYVGPVAIYHLNDVGHPVFWIGLIDVSLSRDESEPTD